MAFGMDSAEKIALLEERILQRVELRGSATWELLTRRNEDLAAILADMDPKAREKFEKNAYATYEDCRVFLYTWGDDVREARRLLADAVEVNNEGDIDEFTDDLVTLLQGFNYWYTLSQCAKDAFDICWRLGTTIPITDTERMGHEGGVPDMFALFDTTAEKAHKRVKADEDRTKKDKGKEKETKPEDRIEERIARPIERVLSRLQRTRFGGAKEKTENDGARDPDYPRAA